MEKDTGKCKSPVNVSGNRRLPGGGWAWVVSLFRADRKEGARVSWRTVVQSLWGNTSQELLWDKL